MTEFERENLSFVLRNKRILLGITGSIAAFKTCDLIRFLKMCGTEVRVVLSQGAENFVTPLTLETLSGNPVLTGFWNAGVRHAQGTHHIDTARWADLILVVPATANILAKMAGGFADDLLTTELLAFTGPVWVAPAMNPSMFAHPAVQNNIRALRERGICFLGPTSGSTACGEEGLGRMMEPLEIIRQIARVSPREAKTVQPGLKSGALEYPDQAEQERNFSTVHWITEDRECSQDSNPTLPQDTGTSGSSGVNPRTLPPHSANEQKVSLPSKKLKSVLITLGPTRSALDPVRYITNRSSGVMGAALAWAASQAGYRVTAVCGPNQATLPPGIEVVPVMSNSEMLAAVQERWSKSDIFMATAAVLDWEIQETSSIKLKREDGTPSIGLKKGADILQWVCNSRQPSQFILGFAAETHLPVENGLNKLHSKKCDALFVNDVSLQGQGFESFENEGWWITPDGPATKLQKMTKNILARRILTLIEERLP